MKRLIRWVEIPTTDFNRAVNFYNKVLQLELTPLDWGEEKMACFPNDEGAIVFSPEAKPGSDGVLVSLQANASINEMLKTIADAGGKVVVPKTKIEAEGRGYFALFTDCEGNKLGLYGDS